MSDAVDAAPSVPSPAAAASTLNSDDSSPLLVIDEFMNNEIEVASANHQEVKTRSEQRSARER